jgi:type II secretory pathway component GspD/PulD (secretin)
MLLPDTNEYLFELVGRWLDLVRLISLIVRFGICLLITASLVAAAESAAARLAHEADKARNRGQIVRAYLLYSEAAARDPQNPAYTANRDALAPSAKLLSAAKVQDADISADLKAIENEGHGTSEPPVELASQKDWEREESLGPLPRLSFSSASASFDLRGDERTLFQQVTATFGIQTVFDPQLELKSGIHFQIDHADFPTALQALTAVTGTFIFPIAEKHIMVARDSEEKRNQLEPHTLLTFPLPDALDQKDLIEAANAVRGVLTLRAIGYDTVSRTVMIRDRVTRARVARSLLEALLLPKAQVSFEVQILSVDEERTYHYGLALPTSFSVIDFGGLPGFQKTSPSVSSMAKLLAFGGGATLFGIGLGDSTFFATYTHSFSHILYDATVVVSTGQTANFHVGDQYPIAQSLYTGFNQGTASIYNPVPQISMVDLGIVLKLTPKVSGDGNIGIDLEAEYKSLGTETFNTVPAINQRAFKGTATVRQGEWAVLAGLDSSSASVTRNGLLGLSQIAGLNQFLSENNRDTQTSNTLIVIKPTVTRLPMSASVSPQYLVGPVRGERVLL